MLPGRNQVDKTGSSRFEELTSSDGLSPAVVAIKNCILQQEGVILLQVKFPCGHDCV